MRTLLLYSVKSFLGLHIAENYYGRFTVRCSPHFDARLRSLADQANPPSADPFSIYDRLFNEAYGGDIGGLSIRAIRSELLEEAERMKESGVIDVERLEQIKVMITESQPREFRPFVLLIPFSGVSNLAKRIPPKQAAHVLAEEYVIETLLPEHFDRIMLR